MYKNILVKPVLSKKPPKIIHYGSIETSDYGKIFTAYYLKEKHQLHICHFKFALKQTIEEFANELQNSWPQAQCIEDNNLTKKLFLNYIQEQKATQEVYVDLKGTEFQVKVWTALLDIPFGEERTYGEVAAMIGKPKAARAVGTAVGSNDIAIFVPCHRVRASVNDKYKYGSGSDLKKKILLNEQKRK